MQRLAKVASQVLASPVKADGDNVVVTSNSPQRRNAPAFTEEQIQELMRITVEYKESVDRLHIDGTVPEMSLWDLLMATNHETGIPPKAELHRVIDEAEAQDSPDLVLLNSLPGPWRDAKTRKEQVRLIQRVEVSFLAGTEQQHIARWQLEYGSHGLGSNIVVPHYKNASIEPGSNREASLQARVIVANPQDAERISRTHVRKDDGFFQIVLYDSVISTMDNEHWRRQRQHLAEVFMPLSSLAKIFPVSLARAKLCANRLGESVRGDAVVDMSDFLLHEAQAQLQLALLGVPEQIMEATNSKIRATFMGDAEKASVGELGKAMKSLMELTRTDKSLALPSDALHSGRPVHGPLSRAVQTSAMNASTNYGNMLLILFAGHDTTGHTMTWLLFELARHPEIQSALHTETSQFLAALNGRDIEYQDLGRGLEMLNRCITETLRLWPAVANGTFRQLQFADTIGGQGGPLELPCGTSVNVVNWSRHRNTTVWGPDADEFNPYRKFEASEIACVGCPLAAVNPQSDRFSPFAHAPRNCLGRNFAQMEMRLIMIYLLSQFEFSLAPPYDRLMHVNSSANPSSDEFQGINRGTMGPMDLEHATHHAWGTRHQYAMKMHARART